MSACRDIRFYYRDGCHLCEEMAAVIHSAWPEVMSVMIWVDVDADAEARASYGLKVPVLICDGKVVSEYRLDADSMCLYFGPGRVPV